MASRFGRHPAGQTVTMGLTGAFAGGGDGVCRRRRCRRHGRSDAGRARRGRRKPCQARRHGQTRWRRWRTSSTIIMRGVTACPPAWRTARSPIGWMSCCTCATPWIAAGLREGLTDGKEGSVPQRDVAFLKEAQPLPILRKRDNTHCHRPREPHFAYTVTTWLPSKRGRSATLLGAGGLVPDVVGDGRGRHGEARFAGGGRSYD